MEYLKSNIFTTKGQVNVTFMVSGLGPSRGYTGITLSNPIRGICVIGSILCSPVLVKICNKQTYSKEICLLLRV
jgi:hypothetical protein